MHILAFWQYIFWSVLNKKYDFLSYGSELLPSRAWDDLLTNQIAPFASQAQRRVFGKRELLLQIFFCLKNWPFLSFYPMISHNVRPLCYTKWALHCLLQKTKLKNLISGLRTRDRRTTITSLYHCATIHCPYLQNTFLSCFFQNSFWHCATIMSIWQKKLQDAFIEY